MSGIKMQAFLGWALASVVKEGGGRLKAQSSDSAALAAPPYPVLRSHPLIFGSQSPGPVAACCQLSPISRSSQACSTISKMLPQALLLSATLVAAQDLNLCKCVQALSKEKPNQN